MPERILHTDEEVDAGRKHGICEGSKAPCGDAGDEAIINRYGYE